MHLRIISGRLGGRLLHLKDGGWACFRPTAQRVREAVSESIKARIAGARVADLCAGSGAFGFEMLSRGAQSVDFVEKDRARAQALQTNARLLGVDTCCTVHCIDIRRFLLSPRHQRYNIVFYDPPYDDEALAQNVPDIVKLCAGDGVVIFEHAKGRGAPEVLRALEGCAVSSRIYGDTEIAYISHAV